MIFVRVVRFEKITAPVREIEHERRGTLAELRLFPPSHQIQLELWLYSRHGTYRFFRLTDAGLREIRQDGEIAPVTVPVAVPATVEKKSVPATVPVIDKTPEAMPGVSHP